jgi:hypothetical protein
MMEPLLMNTLFIVPEREDVKTVFIDASVIRGEKQPLLLKEGALESLLQTHCEEEREKVNDIEGVEEVKVAFI